MAISDEKGGILQRQKLTLYNYICLGLLGFGSISFGYAASIIGTTLGQPSFITYFHLDTRSDAQSMIATMNGLFFAGAVIGTLMLPIVADRFGRKWAIAISAILVILSGALMAGSVDLGMFIAFRFVSGAGSVMLLAAVPILMTEIVPVHNRGKLLDYHAVMLNTGYAIQGWVGFGFFFWKDGSSKTWRVPIVLQCFFPLLLLLGLFVLPESPRWLVKHGREQEAEDILNRLHGDDGQDSENNAAKAEFYQIKTQMAIDQTLDSSWIHILKKPSYRKRALLGIGLGFAIQASGILVINNYGASLYKQLGFDNTKQLLYPAGWLTLSIGTSSMNMLVVDRFPRQKLIAFGLSCCIATLIVEAALVANFVQSDNTAALKAAVAMFFVFQIFYGSCMDGPVYLYLGEIFPSHLRAKGLCLGVATMSLANIVWLQAAPAGFANAGWKFYLVFILCGSACVAMLLALYPNTAGLPLEEVAALFGDEDEVGVYQRELASHPAAFTIVDTGEENVESKLDVNHEEGKYQVNKA